MTGEYTSTLVLLLVTVGVNANVKLVKPYYRCYGTIDLGILIDGSHSIEASGCGNFKRILEFVQRMTSGFGVYPAQARVGVGVYSNVASVPISFKPHRNLEELLAGIKEVPYPDGGTQTGNALTVMKAQLFDYARKQSRKVLVVITDGGTSDDVTIPAKNLKDAGVEVFVVGIGNHARKAELQGMAYDAKHVITAGFKNLLSIERVLRNSICYSKAMYPTPPPPGNGGVPCHNPCYGK